jgi:hypothetical protein
MYWLILAGYVLAGFAALLLTVFVIGQLLLPSHYRATHTFTIHQPPEEAWAAILDYARNPLSGNMLKSLEVLPDENALPSWREHLGGTSILVTTTSSQPPHLVKRHLQDAVVPMSVDWEAALKRYLKAVESV